MEQVIMIEVSQVQILLGKTKLVDSLTEFRLEKRINEHVRLNFTGRSQEAIIDQCLNTNFDQGLIEVYRTDQQSKTLIFRGRLTCVRKIVASQSFSIQAEALSTTCLLDISKRNRSFQDQNMLYTSLLEQVIGKDQYVTKFITEKIGCFYMQYQETDWQFLIRMASQLNTVVVADALSAKAKIYFGPPSLKGNAMPNTVQYQINKDFAGQRFVTENKYLVSQGLDYYQIKESDEILDLGETVNFDGKTMQVFQSTMVLSGSTLSTEAIITNTDGFKRPPLYNEQLTGLSVDAIIEAIAQPQKDNKGKNNQVDRVKIKFNFENESFNEAKAWLFPYSTYYGAEGSAGWYCMPEVKDQVKIYFPSHDESQAIVTASVRQKETERTKDTNIKYFRNRFGKSIVLSENEILIIGKDDSEGKALIRLNEANGILIYSDKAAKIATTKVGDITLSAGRDVKVVAQKGVQLKSKSTSIVIDGNKKMTNVVGLINSVPKKVKNGSPKTVAPTVTPASTNPSTSAVQPSSEDQNKEFYIVPSTALPWYISGEPEMPNESFTAKWKTPPKGKVKYGWDITIKFDITKHCPYVVNKLPSAYPSRVGALGTKDITHHFMEETTEPTLKLKEVLEKNKVGFCGDDIIVKASAIAEGKKYQDDHKGRILGKNPSEKDLIDYLEQQLNNVIKEIKKAHPTFPLNTIEDANTDAENDPKIISTIILTNEGGTSHFCKKHKDKERECLPKYGYPDGWGVMQLDPPSNEMQIWNWKKNVEGGADLIKSVIKTIYNDKNYVKLKTNQMSRWQWRISIYRKYNGGWFWEWRKPNTKEKEKLEKTDPKINQESWYWTEKDRFAYCLKAICNEKKKFDILVDSDYEYLVDLLKANAKDKWNTSWYKNKKNGKFTSVYNENDFDY
jgi:hypothetical protein